MGCRTLAAVVAIPIFMATGSRVALVVIAAALLFWRNNCAWSRSIAWAYKSRLRSERRHPGEYERMMTLSTNMATHGAYPAAKDNAPSASPLTSRVRSRHLLIFARLHARYCAAQIQPLELGFEMSSSSGARAAIAHAAEGCLRSPDSTRYTPCAVVGVTQAYRSPR